MQININVYDLTKVETITIRSSFVQFAPHRAQYGLLRPSCCSHYRVPAWSRTVLIGIYFFNKSARKASWVIHREFSTVAKKIWNFMFEWREQYLMIEGSEWVIYRSLDHTGFSSRCYRSLFAWKMHLHLRRLPLLTTTIPSNKQTKFIQQNLKSGNRDVVAQYDHSCYIRKVGHSVPRWPLDVVIVLILRVF